VSVVSHRCGTLPAVRRKLRAALSLLLMPLPAAACSATPTSHSAATATVRSPASSAAHPAPSAAAKPTRAAVSAAATTWASTGAATAALAALPVKGRAPMTGYRRDQFGPAWADVNRNGCDTRTICIRSLPGATLPQ
jgi:hypothetical protein